MRGVDSVQCKEAIRLITPFIEKEIPQEKLRFFLEHIRNCKECREELELYYTIHKYIESSDRDWFFTYNFKAEFEKELKEANHYVRWTNIISFCKDIITALSMIGVLVVLTLQLQLWGLI